MHGKKRRRPSNDRKFFSLPRARFINLLFAGGTRPYHLRERSGTTSVGSEVLVDLDGAMKGALPLEETLTFMQDRIIDRAGSIFHNCGHEASSGAARNLRGADRVGKD